jgi:cytochrome P450
VIVTDEPDIEVAEIAKRFHTTNLEVMEPDPYGTMESLRKKCPAFKSELYGGYYVFTKHADQRTILRDANNFSSRTTMIPPLPGGGFGPPVEADPPLHSEYRKALDGYFTMARMTEKSEEIRDRARVLLAPFIAEGGGDVMAAFCRPLPTITFILMAGLPVEDLPQLQIWMDTLLKAGGDPEKREYATDVVSPLVREYFHQKLNERETMLDPPNDVLTGIVRAKLGGNPWSKEDQIYCIMQLVFGGLETVMSTLGLSLLFLAENPEHRRQLVDNRAIIPDAVEEFLRYFTIETTARTVTADIEVAGVPLHVGDRVLLPLASSGRDEEAFPNPDIVDFGRHPGQHLAFGMGPHRCMGSHVARVELRIALEEVIDAMPEFSLAQGTRPKRRWGTVFGLDDLDLALHS